MRRPRLPWIALFLGSLLAPLPARADDAAQADKLFKEARELMKAGRMADACPKLEASHRLDPGTGSAYRLGECYEEIGRFDEAWNLFTKAAELARNTKRRDRMGQAASRATALLPKIAFLTLSLLPEVQGNPTITVTCDGAVILPPNWGKPLSRMPGRHTIEVKAPDRVLWQKTIELAAGQSITAFMPPPGDPPGDRSAPPPDAARPKTQPFVIGGAVLASAGTLLGAGLAVASFMMASKRDKDSRATCETIPDCKYNYDEFYRVATANASFYTFIAAGTIGLITLIYGFASAEKKTPAAKTASRLIPTGTGIEVLW